VPSERRNARVELRAWYLTRLRPRLARAASTGVVTPAAADALDRQVRDVLDLPARSGEDAA